METSYSYALKMDEQDPLHHFRQQFHIPKQPNGEDVLYFCGNSLGLSPQKAAQYLQQEVTDWQQMGVKGYFNSKNPWVTYQELFPQKLSPIVGAKPREVVVMNTLSANLHFMMVSFYRPTSTRYKIVIEKAAFPSDKYAVASQLRFHGFTTDDALLELTPRAGEEHLRQEDIEAVLKEHADSIALIMIGGVNYYTGQAFNMEKITKVGHEIGAIVGFDLAHAVGNIKLSLHDWGADFAVWCHYKYLNSGPGASGGAFVHERHLNQKNIPRFEGWWGQDVVARFKMEDNFQPAATAEAWQQSNVPIFSTAPLLASLELFEEAGMEALLEKSKNMGAYLEFLLKSIETDRIHIITPNERGCQLSIQVKNGNRNLFEQLSEKGVVVDWRNPDVIRVAPTPLYNTFADIHSFYTVLKELLQAKG